MATAPTQVRIDATVKAQANELFDELGLDMSTAVNLFLRQCIMRGGLPFNVEVPRFSKQTLDAMPEARTIAHDPNAKGYNSMDELNDELNT